MKQLLAASAFVALALSAPLAQSPDPISAEDILKVATATVLDFSEDGRRVAVGTRRLFDNAETNHRRYGDPSYVVPTMVELSVIDTRSGVADTVGNGLMNIRQAAWTRDSSRLALLTAAERGEVFVQGIDEAKPRSITPRPKVDPSVKPPSGTVEDAESFSVTSFSRDGSRLLLTSKKGWYVAPPSPTALATAC